MFSRYHKTDFFLSGKSWSDPSPESAGLHPEWLWSDTRPFLLQFLFSTPSGSVCHTCRSSVRTIRGTALEPEIKFDKQKLKSRHMIHRVKAIVSVRPLTSVICSSCSSNGLPSFRLKKVATPTISSFLLTMGRDRTFLMTKPVSSTASFWKVAQDSVRIRKMVTVTLLIMSFYFTSSINALV